MSVKDADSEQTGLIRNKKGQIIGGKPPNGLDKNPQNRNPGGWKKEQSFSYQYKRFMNMTVTQFEKWNKETKKKDRTIAEDLAARRIMASKASLPDVKEITDRTEGKAKQSLDVTTDGDSLHNPFSDMTNEELKNLGKDLSRLDDSRANKKKS